MQQNEGKNSIREVRALLYPGISKWQMLRPIKDVIVVRLKHRHLYSVWTFFPAS